MDLYYKFIIKIFDNIIIQIKNYLKFINDFLNEI